MARVDITTEQLRKIQLIQLELLKEVDRLCKAHDINYCIIAGTTLGAVRHGGYIPWDDDADVAFLREEYDKFAKVCQANLDTDKFYFQDNAHTPGYRWGYGKLRRKGTQFVRLNQEHMPYEQGVFIDLFPLDNVPENMFMRRIHNLKCTYVRKLMWSEVGKYSEKNLLKRLVYKIMARMSEQGVRARYERLKLKSNRKPSELVRILTFPTPNNGYYGYYKKWYVELSEIEFEGFKFPCAKDYHGYLSFKFGDYMELPPMEMRKVHPVSRLFVDV